MNRVIAGAPPKINGDMGKQTEEEPHNRLKNYSNLSAGPNSGHASVVAILSGEILILILLRE
jgi:hypothetical protein